MKANYIHANLIFITAHKYSNQAYENFMFYPYIQKVDSIFSFSNIHFIDINYCIRSACCLVQKYFRKNTSISLYKNSYLLALLNKTTPVDYLTSNRLNNTTLRMLGLRSDRKMAVVIVGFFQHFYGRSNFNINTSISL